MFTWSSGIWLGSGYVRIMPPPAAPGTRVMIILRFGATRWRQTARAAATLDPFTGGRATPSIRAARHLKFVKNFKLIPVHLEELEVMEMLPAIPDGGPANQKIKQSNNYLNIPQVFNSLIFYLFSIWFVYF